MRCVPRWCLDVGAGLTASGHASARVFHIRKKRGVIPPGRNENASSGGFPRGSDGTRTRDLRCDRPHRQQRPRTTTDHQTRLDTGLPGLLGRDNQRHSTAPISAVWGMNGARRRARLHVEPCVRRATLR